MANQRGKSRTQEARSAAMREKLLTAAKQSLMDKGYGRTTAVEVCARAGVTRGALFHHFAGLSALLAATLDEICTSMVVRGREAAAARDPRNLLSGYIDTAWSNFGHPDFKIIIEVWLAARNDPALRGELAPVIQRFRALMSPELNADLAMMVGRSEKNIAFYRLILEAMIGMALGRAVSPDGKPMGHEEAVVGLLKDIASGIEKG